jgi:hypothetical protein
MDMSRLWEYEVGRCSCGGAVVSVEYQTAFGKESEWSSEKLNEKIGWDSNINTRGQLKFSYNDIMEAYRFGINKGSEIINKDIEFGQICGSFFQKIYTHYAITLNHEKVKEALELIYRYSRASDYDGDWEALQDKIILQMKDWK